MAQEPSKTKTTRQDPIALKWCREAKGWTQRDLAAVCGVSESHWSKLESGQASATPRLLIRIAESLNCPTSILETKINRPFIPERVA